MSVFITDMAIFVPNEPVNNDDIENVLGKIDNVPSRAKRVVLKNNGIKTRYYAIDRNTGNMTHTNAQLAAEAVRGLNPHDAYAPEDIECLCCGTTSPDLLFPGHALMVQGELGLSPLEAVTTAGICISGMLALKYAFMNIATGMSQNAVAVGSELASSFMRAKFFAGRNGTPHNIEKKPILGFDSDFLRWMLSDGAGAAYLTNAPKSDGIALRIDWIDYLAFAGEIETCMYGGGVKGNNGHVAGWRQMEAIDPAEEKHLMAVKQDIRLLDHNIVQTFERCLKASITKHRMTPEAIDWFLPHYSSAYFRDKFFTGLQNIDFEIPYDKWYTNLPTMGNTGSAAIYIILADLMRSGRLEKDQRLLCFIPESGRFAHCFMHLTVV
ncbi:MAG: beta-ketoacyl-ACP synthase III [Desulfobacteraceae bacterium]|jgi:3-oxoacyl-[acyl-carrier-protein] synthase-3